MKKIKLPKKEAFTIKTLREIAIASVDLLIVAVCFMGSVILAQVYTLGTELSSDIVTKAFMALPIFLIIFFLASWCFRTFKVVWRFARARDFLRIIGACIVAVAVFSALDQFLLHLICRPDTFVPGFGKKFQAYPAYIITLFSTSSTLIISRLIYEFGYSFIKSKPLPFESKRTMIIGAGHTASVVLDEITRAESPYEPICLIDDDPDKQGRIIDDVEVVGRTDEIPYLARKMRIKSIIFAVPSCSPEDRKRILAKCVETGCQLKVIPYVSELIDHVDYVAQIKDVNIDDLLGREQIKFDDEGVAGYIHDKVIMITGGGGSIGSELVRQIAKYKPRRIIVLDVYENCAYDIQQEMKRLYGARLEFYVEIASITDYDKMRDVFEQYHPQIIFHAAAHKHVPLMETNPEEAVKNNVFGTYNITRLAEEYAAKKFIMISTDKAVNPTNVMGATKRCCEKIVQMSAQNSKNCEFASVRFGNVLGSNGSVIPLFREQILAGGPVTVTHPDIIRYFMTIPEAVSLVLQAGAFAKGGEIFVLDMGEQVKILKLAENLITMMGYKPYEEIKIIFTGLRPGEKLYEEMLMHDEGLARTENEKIFIGKQLEVDEETFKSDLADMREICRTNDKEAVIGQLEKLVPTFTHDTSFINSYKADVGRFRRESEDIETGELQAPATEDGVASEEGNRGASDDIKQDGKVCKSGKPSKVVKKDGKGEKTGGKTDVGPDAKRGA